MATMPNKDPNYARLDEMAMSSPSCNGEPVEGEPVYGTSSGGRFVVQGYRDVWAAVLFLITVFATLGMTGYHIAKDGDDAFDFDHVDTLNRTHKEKDKDNDKIPNLALWIPVSAVVACILGLTFLIIMRKWARQYIVFSWVLQLVLIAAQAIFFAAIGAYAGCFIFIIIGALLALFLYLARHRIPFSGLLLEVSSGIVFNYKATIVTAFLACFVAGVYSILTLVSINPFLPYYEEYVVNGVRHSRVVKDGNVPVVILYVFFFFWAVTVIAGVMHVTACGVAATWYFFSSTNMPANPTLKSFQRATTTSFGSICFGSLIVAILRTIRFIFTLARDNRGGFVACCIDCMLRCIENLMQYFNQWAFAQVAIYGKSYIEAAKATFRMMKTGDAWEAVVNDSLVDAALGATMLLGGIATGVLCGLVSWSLLVGVLALFIGFLIIRVMMAPVESSVMTIFICFVDTRDMMMHVNPELYNMFLERLQVHENEQA